MLISDELLEYLGDEFLALGLRDYDITFYAFVKSPGSHRNLDEVKQRYSYVQRRQQKTTTGGADERMSHTRYPRNLKKSNFNARARA